ncbi:MAG: MarR family winged helix-turn-helix transcriptional regulator [Lautropia sp.]
MSAQGNRPRARAAAPDAGHAPVALEASSFLTSVIYWTGVLEDKFNAEFMARLGAGRNIIPRWRVLSVLAERSGITVNDLAGITRIERSALSHLLPQLESEGLVERRSSREDRRLVQVHLTARGRVAFRTMLPVRRAILREAAAGLPPERVAAMLATVQALVSGLDALEQARTPSSAQCRATDA